MSMRADVDVRDVGGRGCDQTGERMDPRVVLRVPEGSGRGPGEVLGEVLEGFWRVWRGVRRGPGGVLGCPEGRGLAESGMARMVIPVFLAIPCGN